MSFKSMTLWIISAKIQTLTIPFRFDSIHISNSDRKSKKSKIIYCSQTEKNLLSIQTID